MLNIELTEQLESQCRLCPRQCLASRTAADPGFCGVAEPPGQFRIGRVMVHAWEEPFISGWRGSGTVFFSGCHLGCVFCQNTAISHRHQGTLLSQAQLVAAMQELASQGVHNFNLVSASHYAGDIPALVAELRSQGLQLPLVWNSSGYERVETLQSLAGLVDIYLPDVKFADPGLAGRLAGAQDYLPVTLAALAEMKRQQPVNVYAYQAADPAPGPVPGPGIGAPAGAVLRRGLVVRHLVLPGCYRDSFQVLDAIAATLPLDTPLSLMCQYTPLPELAGRLANEPDLRRRLTTYEYRKVIDYAQKLGFTHLLGQERSASSAVFTPDFSHWRDGGADGGPG